MTTALFFNWLERFDSYVGKKEGRRVALFIDNCSAHGSIQNLPALSNVDVILLPPNTTSKLQPLDAGIIAAFNWRYRRFEMERAMDLIEENVKNIYNVDDMTAMKWIKSIGMNFDSSIIRNCWKHSGLLVMDSAQEDTMAAENGCGSGEKILGEQIETFVPQRTTMSIAELLNPNGEDDCVRILQKSQGWIHWLRRMGKKTSQMMR